MSEDEFRLAETPIECGTTLIEASAGTGKTFTLAGLVLRFVIEKQLAIDEILAVTYTVAATEELRDRVRTRLRDALADLRRGKSNDAIVSQFLKTRETAAAARAQQHLDLAIASFDEAQIFTIHGFCQRMLRDHAFESGTIFESELLSEPRDLFDEITRDFWRRKIYEAPPLISRVALARKLAPEQWNKLLANLQNHIGLRILPESSDPSENLASRLDEAFGALAAQWKKQGREITTLLRECKTLSRDKQKSSFHEIGIAKIAKNLDLLFSNPESAPPDFLASIESLASSNVARCTKPKSEPPAHAFFDACEEFAALEEQFVHRLAHEFVEFAQSEMPRRKQRQNALTYDDLLTRLRDALHGPEGEPFAQKIGARYKAALIDEFQDTDRVQTEIFQRAFGSDTHHLLFIGDPKQAIYAFRGADVFAYLEAARSASRHYTLRTNFRSEKNLLAGINALFGRAKNPFLLGEIEYREIRAPETPRKNFRALEESPSEPPLRFRLLQCKSEDVFTKTKADEAIRAAVVADIVRLRARGAKLGDDKLKLRDIAVLVRTKFQAREIQSALRDAGIKSVLQTDESVFSSEEAHELQRLLDGVLEPGREQLLKSALATNLVGFNAQQIANLNQNEKEWSAQLEKFADWRERWARDGFLTMFRRLLVSEKVRERLVEQPGGERRLTNFLHLAELLHCEEIARRFAPEALGAWLRRQRGDSGDSAEEFQLRLESDEDAVLIATIHKSKGLEYPVVFCPFLWRTIDLKRNDRDVLFHDGQQRMTLDLRGKAAPVESREKWEREELQESLRLAYVAITRAQNRCYIYAGACSDIEKSALGHLLGVESPEQTIAAVGKLASESCEAISASMIDPEADAKMKLPQEADAGAEKFQAREFRGVISQTAMIASFTALTSERAQEIPDRDAGIDAPTEEPHAEPDPLAMFKPGARTGLFFHEVLEEIDFQNPASIESTVAQKIKSHGIHASGAHEAAAAQLRRLGEIKLAPDLYLNRVAKIDRLNEVEFAFPIPSLKKHDANSPWLRDLFAKHGGPELPTEIPSSLGRLRFQSVEGFMHGFIDLLFHANGKFWLVDWKTNALERYDETGVRASMAAHAYFLQYHLYVIAADLFLRRQVPGYDYEKNFGGVFYIFLRGIDPQRPQRAIYRDRPDEKLLRALREALTQK